MSDVAEMVAQAEEGTVAKEAVALTVVPVEDVGRTHTLAPFDVSRQLPSLLQLAKTLSTARGMIPAHLKSEGEIVAALLAGAELGIPPMASLRNIHLIDGKVGLDAGLQLGLLLRAGVRPQWVESSDKRAVLRLTRPGFAPHEQVYTIEDAKAAGLAGKQNWQRHPKAMLRARCVSAAVKAYAADVVTGVYTPEELEDAIPQRVEVTSVDVGGAPVPDDAHVTAVMEAQAKERLASDKLAEELGPMIDACDTAEALLSFCHHNGFALRSMHTNAKSRLWTRIRRRAAAIVNPTGSKQADALSAVGVFETELKDEISAAPGLDDDAPEER